MSPCVKESQHLGLHYLEAAQYISGGGLFPLLSPGKTHLLCWVSFWAPQCKGGVGTLKWSQRRPAGLGSGTHDIRGETMRLGTVCPQEKEVIAVYNYLMGDHRNLWSWSLELVLLWAGGWIRGRCPFFFHVTVLYEGKDREKTRVCRPLSTWGKEKQSSPQLISSPLQSWTRGQEEELINKSWWTSS